MKFFFKLSLLLSIFILNLYAQGDKTRQKIDFSLVISGGVSLGAYEAGYNWALIKMLNKVKAENLLVDPQLRAISGASAGSLNSLFSAIYWCQKDSVHLRNSIDDNLFYDTWVNVGIEDLVIKGNDPDNKSTLFTTEGYEKKGVKIIEHLNQPIYKKDCEVPLGIAVTKVTPVVEDIGGIKVKNQNFSAPLTFREKNGRAIVENKEMPPSTAFYLSIPGIEQDSDKLITLLLASAAFPGFFQQRKLDYNYKGKDHSHYFIDGGLYDNVPLDLAVSLDKNASYFFFINPGNMRKETVKVHEEAEELPVGFIKPNLMPVFTSFDIMQSVKLYTAINKHFRGTTDKKLVLSSRYHPLAGNYLAHFGAFLDVNFRIYDYYVGVYDAIYHLAAGFKRNFPQMYGHLSQIEIMNYLKTLLGIDTNPDALAAYNLFLKTEFQHIKPKTTDSFSAIYNAFNLQKSDTKRYDNAEFKIFLSKLDIRYLKQSENSFIAYAKEDIDNWHRKPLRSIISRIATLENNRDASGKSGSFGTEIAIASWVSTPFIKEKKGFEFLPLDVPQDEGNEGLKTALRLLPGEIAVDIKNGGMSFGYMARYYPRNKDIVSGYEGKASYVAIHDSPDFVRGDISVYKEFDEFLKLGLGASFFGNMEGSFYERESAYGFNTYVDVLDIFRLTYVRRDGDLYNNNYIYFGFENIPSLIYWLNR